MTGARAAGAEPLLRAGFERQRLRRATLRTIPPARRRLALEREAVGLAQRLAAGHAGYGRLYGGRDLATMATIPVLDKAALADPDFAVAAGVDPAGAAEFLARPFELGSRYDAERVLFTSSGSTGERLLVPYHLTDLGRSLEAFHARAVMPARAGRGAGRLLYIGLLDRHNGGNAWMYHLGALLAVRLAHLFDDEAALLDLVCDFRPDVVLTRPHLLHALGRRAAADGRQLPAAHLLSVGDRLTEPAAAEIERWWAARPHNSFSTVETGPLGYQDDASVPGLDLYDDLSLVEVVDEAGRPVREPERPGRIVVTTLYRSSFPLVRYAIGDTAGWLDADCTRLGFPRGRAGLRLALTPAGAAEPTVLDEASLTWPSPPGVREYQLRQTGPDSVLVRWAPAVDAQPADAEPRLRAAVTGLLAAAGLRAGAIRLRTERVADLVPDPVSGKVKRLVPLAGGAVRSHAAEAPA